MQKQIREAKEAGEELGLTADELAFYDALTKPQAIKDFYENAELIAITKELAEKLRKNRTIDWQKRDSSKSQNAYDDTQVAERSSLSSRGNGRCSYYGYEPV